MTIVIHNQKVIDFFSRNPNLDANLLFANVIDFYEYVLNTMSNGNTNQLLSYIIDNSHKIDTFKSEIHNALSNIKEFLDNDSKGVSIHFSSVAQQLDSYKSELDSLKSLDQANSHLVHSEISNLKELVSKLTHDISSTVLNKLFELRTTYVEDVKAIVYQHDTDTLEKIKQINDLHNHNVISNTSNIINELFPKLSEKQHLEITHNIQAFKNELSSDIKTIFNNVTTPVEQLQLFSDSLHQKFIDLHNSLQQPLYGVITNSEERITNSLNQLQSITSHASNKSVSTEENVTNIHSLLTKLLSKFNNSSQKGKISENLLSCVLSKAFPSAEVIDNTNDPHSCDFRLKRVNKQDILIENKTYSKNVDKEEVSKFLEDIEKHECCGMLISQESGISNKENWQIDIHNGNVVIFLHNVNYDTETLQLAVQIIDNIYQKLLDISNLGGDSFGVSPELLVSLNNELQLFIKQRDNIINLVRNFQKDATNKLKELQLPVLTTFMTSHFSSPTITKQFECKYCEFVGETKQAVNGHLGSCKNNPKRINKMNIDT
jgi:hypothetical protein